MQPDISFLDAFEDKYLKTKQGKGVFSSETLVHNRSPLAQQHSTLQQACAAYPPD